MSSRSFDDLQSAQKCRRPKTNYIVRTHVEILHGTELAARLLHNYRFGMKCKYADRRIAKDVNGANERECVIS